MSLTDAINNATNVHKLIAETYIHGSQKTLSIDVISSGVVATSGSSMFADLDDADSEVEVGPFYCIWTDADAARAGGSTAEAGLLLKFVAAEVVAKLWLEDVLLVADEPYGENYFDRALSVNSEGLKYKILGYDRYGLGVTNPYIIAVALKGSFGYEE